VRRWRVFAAAGDGEVRDEIVEAPNKLAASRKWFRRSENIAWFARGCSIAVKVTLAK
jgi:hypothetical protein